MPFDPTLPVNNSPIVSAELRNQFNGLKGLIDGLQAQIDALAFLPAPEVFLWQPPNNYGYHILKSAQPTAPDTWAMYVSQTGNGNPDTHPAEWQLDFNDSGSDDVGAYWMGDSTDTLASGSYLICRYAIGGKLSAWSATVAVP